MQIARRRLDFQLFTIRGVYRNQRVARFNPSVFHSPSVAASSSSFDSLPARNVAFIISNRACNDALDNPLNQTGRVLLYSILSFHFHSVKRQFVREMAEVAEVLKPGFTGMDTVVLGFQSQFIFPSWALPASHQNLTPMPLALYHRGMPSPYVTTYPSARVRPGPTAPGSRIRSQVYVLFGLRQAQPASFDA